MHSFACFRLALPDERPPLRMTTWVAYLAWALALFEGAPLFLRCDRFYLDRLCGYAAHDREWLNIFRGDAHRAHHPVFANLHPAQHRCMVSDACLGADLRLVIADDHAVVEIVSVRVDVGVIGNRRSFMNDDLSPVIEQNVLVNGAIVFDGQVVTEGKLHAVKDFDVVAAMFEYMAG